MPKYKLHTILTPGLLPNYTLEKSIVVIIDVFRATTTIATALYNGAQSIIPVETVEEAQKMMVKKDYIVGGERDGKKIDGFSCGNSPMEYSTNLVKNKTIVFTTTNGTKLLKKTELQNPSLIISGAFVNQSAIQNFILKNNQPVYLCCAGWKNRFNMEDALFAGAIIHSVKKYYVVHCDSSFICCEIYKNYKNDLLKIAPKLTHYHRLVEQFGLIDDIEYCLTPDLANVLPMLKNGELIRV